VACVKCGNTLYSGFDLRSPNDILKATGYKCRKCGAKLAADKFTIQVKRIDGSFS
jgi:DNA-directed RNA polymerase subunit RPC12/RpoP